MRSVYAISGGVSKFAKARPDKTFAALVKEAYDYALADIGLSHPQFVEIVDGSVASYFSDHFTRQLMAGIMVQDYLGLCPKPSHRVEGGGATGGVRVHHGIGSFRRPAPGHDRQGAGALPPFGFYRSSPGGSPGSPIAIRCSAPMRPLRTSSQARLNCGQGFTDRCWLPT